MFRTRTGNIIHAFVFLSALITVSVNSFVPAPRPVTCSLSAAPAAWRREAAQERTNPAAARRRRGQEEQKEEKEQAELDTGLLSYIQAEVFLATVPLALLALYVWVGINL